MKNKKVIALLLCVLAVMSLAMTACTPDNPTNGPEQTDPLGSSSTTYVPKDVTVSIHVKNQYGTATKVKLTIRSKATDDVFPVETDDKGAASVILLEGEYMVYFEEVPENHLGNDVQLTVKAGMQPVALEIIDNTPNGTKERPFPVQEESKSYHFASNETFHFSVRAGVGRTIVINNANAEVVFQEVTFTPDADGKIEIRLQAEDPKTVLYFAVTNKSAEEQDIEIVPMTDPGTRDNPFELEALDVPVTALVVGESGVYYRWVATKTGTLVVNCENTNNNISMYNHNTYAATSYSNGAASISLKVNEGDVILIEITTMKSVNPEGDEIVFTATVE